MKTYILTVQVIAIADESIFSNNIIGAYATQVLANEKRANEVYKMKRRFNTETVYIMSGGAQMISDGTHGYIFTVKELEIHEA